jgi:hypothetical protein
MHFLKTQTIRFDLYYHPVNIILASWKILGKKLFIIAGQMFIISEHNGAHIDKVRLNE